MRNLKNFFIESSLVKGVQGKDNDYSQLTSLVADFTPITYYLWIPGCYLTNYLFVQTPERLHFQAV